MDVDRGGGEIKEGGGVKVFRMHYMLARNGKRTS